MDLYRSTSTRLAGTTDDLALAVRALADKDAIRALGVLYSVAVDDHDLDTVVACFAPDGSFSRAGVTYTGRDKLRDGDRWVFAARELRFMYNVPFEQMPTSFADSRRIRLPGLPRAEADYPETLPTWNTYRS